MGLRVIAVFLLFPVAAAAAAEPTFEKLLVREAELPDGWRLVDGAAANAPPPQPRSFYDLPEMKGLLPKPVAKRAQTIVAGDRPTGVVYLFEYDEGTSLAGVREFLTGLLYGEDGHRSAEHPAEMLFADRFLFVFAYPMGDPAAEWVKARLRKEFRIPAMRFRKDLAPLVPKLLAVYRTNEVDAGLKLLADREEQIADWSFGWYFRGEFGGMKEDWALAERGYAKALELSDSLVDPLEDGLVWACLDGLGLAIYVGGDPERSLPVLEKAKQFAAERGMPERSRTSYNLACALSRLERFDAALAELREAIRLDPKWKESARTDPDFARARERKDFQELLR